MGSNQRQPTYQIGTLPTELHSYISGSRLPAAYCFSLWFHLLYQELIYINKNFKWVGVFVIPLFCAVDSALNRATFYLRPDQLLLVFFMVEVVGFEPTRQLITDLSVFKTELFSLLSTLPYKCRGYRTLRSPIWRLERLLRFPFMVLPVTHLLLRSSVNLQPFLLWDFHLLCRGCYDSWREKKDSNLRTISRLTR